MFAFNCYLDGKRCGQTIARLFEKAQNPDKVFIGLVEQAHEDDLLCLEAYCRDLGECIGIRMPEIGNKVSNVKLCQSNSWYDLHGFCYRMAPLLYAFCF